MNFEQEVTNFQKSINEKIELFFYNKPSYKNGSDYFTESFLDFFRELQPIGQNILNSYEDCLSREEYSRLRKTIQQITYDGLVHLKERLAEG